MRDFVLLRHRQRLGLGTGTRLVVAREREHHDQAEQHGEAGRDDAEEARGTVTVAEIAAVGSASTDEQQRPDSQRCGRDDDHSRHEDVHPDAASPLAVRSHHSERMTRTGARRGHWRGGSRPRACAARAQRRLRGRSGTARPIERRLELGAVLLLAVTTLATAWCGYQAARWSGEQSQHYARASATRVKAVQAATRAGQLRIDDLLYFNEWLDARARRRSRTGRPLPPPVPPRVRARLRRVARAEAVHQPGCHPGTAVHARSTASADLATARSSTPPPTRSTRRARRPRRNDDRYILATVFFAAVLFFAGISLRLDWRPLRIAVLGMALRAAARRRRLRAHPASGLARSKSIPGPGCWLSRRASRAVGAVSAGGRRAGLDGLEGAVDVRREVVFAEDVDGPVATQRVAHPCSWRARRSAGCRARRGCRGPTGVSARPSRPLG